MDQTDRSPAGDLENLFDLERGKADEHPVLGGRLGVARRASRAELVSRAIENQIASDNLATGTKLGTRQELRAHLKVAPSTVSEAIKLLEDRGQVTTRTGPGGGVFVAQPQAQVRLARSIMLVAGPGSEITDAMEVRDILEHAVIAQAAQAGHGPEALQPMLSSMEALAAAQRTAEFFKKNLDFHAEVAALCRNEVLRSMYRGVLEVVRDRQPHLELLPGQNQKKLLGLRTRVHRSIADAIVAGDVRAARSAARAHARRGDLGPGVG